MATVPNAANAIEFEPQDALPTPRAASLAARAAQTTAVLVRHLAPLGLDRNRARRSGTIATALRQSFEELGATYVKFGQLLASSPGLFGEEFSAEFRAFLDTGPPVSYAVVRRTVERDLGRPLSEAFVHFERAPFAAASLAVVHKARLRDGRTVAVKVLRPGIEQTLAADLGLMRWPVETLASQFGSAQAAQLDDLLRSLRDQIGEEIDLRNELEWMQRFRRLLVEANVQELMVPEPHPEVSGRRVLTMEFVEGIPVDDLSSVTAHCVDPAPLVKALICGWFALALRYGASHGDVHAGNLLLCRDGRLALLDWGIVVRLDDRTRYFLRQLVVAALGDETAWDRIRDNYLEIYGSGLGSYAGLEGPALTAVMRSQLEPLFTRPFGEVDLAKSLLDSPEVIPGSDTPAMPFWEGVRRRREQRRLWRLRRLNSEQGGPGDSYDRGTTLLGKQVVYFERYGKLFLPDVPLIHDPVFFAQLLRDTNGKTGDKKGAGETVGV
jgi:hypothetical protein